MKKIRQPIITICGHVDHGKTSILDCLRGTCVQKNEAGGITQKISFTSYPLEQLKKSCPLIENSKIKLSFPGFLLIDTPGHAAFTNLRKRGGSLADLAVLVIDVNEGIKPQTAEVIQILKSNKTPFLIALNKIDNVSGWRTDKEKPIKESIESQPPQTKDLFNEKYMTLIASLNSHGFDSDIYYNIDDFTKKIALVPTSARTKQGIQELILVLCGLSQKYLENKLHLNKDAKGVILEVKKEKNNDYAEAVLYDGELEKSDEIAVANIEGNPIITKIRILEEIEPLCKKFKPKDKVQASTGLRMQLIEKIDVLPGMPFVSYTGSREKIKETFKKEISESVNNCFKELEASYEDAGYEVQVIAPQDYFDVELSKEGITLDARKQIKFTKGESTNIEDNFKINFPTKYKQTQKKNCGCYGNYFFNSSDLCFHNNLPCLKFLSTCAALFTPWSVSLKKLLGSPIINFSFLKARKGLSSFRESGQIGYLKNFTASGNKMKHSLTNLSKLHCSLFEITECMLNNIKSLADIFKFFAVFFCINLCI